LIEKNGNDGLLKLAARWMPVAKCLGRLLVELPEPNLIWFTREEFTDGQLGKISMQ